VKVSSRVPEADHFVDVSQCAERRDLEAVVCEIAGTARFRLNLPLGGETVIAR